MQVLLPFTPSTHTTKRYQPPTTPVDVISRRNRGRKRRRCREASYAVLRSAAISSKTERSSHRRRPSINLAAVSRPPTEGRLSVSHHRRGGSSLPLLVGGGKIAIAVYALLLIEEENRALSRDFLQPRHRPTSLLHCRNREAKPVALPLEREDRRESRVAADDGEPTSPTVDNAIDELGRRSPSSTPIAVKPQPGLQGLRLMLAGDYELLTASYRTPSLWRSNAERRAPPSSTVVLTNGKGTFRQLSPPAAVIATRNERGEDAGAAACVEKRSRRRGTDKPPRSFLTHAPRPLTRREGKPFRSLSER
nr:hypothetical protein Iba_chr03fCG2310 [Ipomoea batatas]